MIIVFLWQPLFLNLLQNHIFRVLLPNRPYQELNMNKDKRYNVLRKTFTFIKTGDPVPIRPKLAPRSFPPARARAQRRGDLQFFMKEQQLGMSLVASSLTCQTKWLGQVQGSSFSQPYRFCCMMYNSLLSKW